MRTVEVWGKRYKGGSFCVMLMSVIWRFVGNLKAISRVLLFRVRSVYGFSDQVV